MSQFRYKQRSGIYETDQFVKRVLVTMIIILCIGILTDYISDEKEA